MGEREGFNTLWRGGTGGGQKMYNSGGVMDQHEFLAGSGWQQEQHSFCINHSSPYTRSWCL